MLRRFSLTSRLTAFFTSVAAAVVLGLGLLFLIATDRHFQELDRAALRDKKLLIESILAHANSSEDAKWRLEDALSHHHGLYAVVNDSQGNTLFQSAGFHLPERSHSGSSSFPMELDFTPAAPQGGHRAAGPVRRGRSAGA